MKKRLLMLMPFIFLIVGCNDKHLSFSGESENWKGEYSANVSDNETREDGKYIFGYKKATNDTSFKNLEIIINDGETEWSESDYKAATISITSSCSGCSTRQKDDSIDVTIKWDDGKVESFKLESSDNITIFTYH